MPKVKVKLSFKPYTRGGDVTAEIDATVRGDIAIHRPAWVKEDGTLSIYAKAWTVSHVPTGDRLESLLPRGWRDNMNVRAPLIEWAEAVQQVEPDFWAEARKPDFGARMRAETATGEGHEYLPLSKLARGVIDGARRMADSRWPS